MASRRARALRRPPVSPPARLSALLRRADPLLCRRAVQPPDTLYSVDNPKSTPPFHWKDYAAGEFRLHAARASVPDPTLAKCTTPQSTAFPYPWAAGDECVTYSVDEKVGPAWNAGACPGIPDAAHTGGNWFDAAWNRFSTSDCNLTLALLGPPVVAECHDRGDGTAGCILAMPAHSSAYMECEIEGECTTADSRRRRAPPAPVQTVRHARRLVRRPVPRSAGLLIVLLFHSAAAAASPPPSAAPTAPPTAGGRRYCRRRRAPPAAA